jgi:hypothetical protein
MEFISIQMNQYVCMMAIRRIFGNIWKYCKKAAMDRDLREFFIKFGHANIHNFIYLQLYIFVISLTILSY